MITPTWETIVRIYADMHVRMYVRKTFAFLVGCVVFVGEICVKMMRNRGEIFEHTVGDTESFGKSYNQTNYHICVPYCSIGDRTLSHNKHTANTGTTFTSIGSTFDIIMHTQYVPCVHTAVCEAGK